MSPPEGVPLNTQDLKPLRDNETRSLIGMQKVLKDKRTPKIVSAKECPQCENNLTLVHLPGTQFGSSYSFEFCIILSEIWLKFLKL